VITDDQFDGEPVAQTLSAGFYAFSIAPRTSTETLTTSRVIARQNIDYSVVFGTSSNIPVRANTPARLHMIVPGEAFQPGDVAGSGKTAAPADTQVFSPAFDVTPAGLITGIITEKVMDSIKGDSLIGSFVSLEEASAEVGKITNVYKNDDIDLTILLTHIGYDSDLELAKMLSPEWGVDLIIGGHSHTVLETPTPVNGTLIKQAGVADGIL